MPWPTITDLETFVGQSGDATLDWALAAAIDYGAGVLDSTDGVFNDPDDAVFQACLDYASSLYTMRIGGNDIMVSGVEGTTPQQRYRRILLASRPVGFA